MISEEKFFEIELEHGCGYWNVCWEHACPCAVTTESKGYSKELYNSILKDSQEVGSQEFD